MSSPVHTKLRSLSSVAPALCLLMLSLAIVPAAFGARAASRTTPITAFQPGETLTYDVSWSSVVKAGTAVMEVKEEKTAEGKLLRLILNSRTEGVLGKLYPLGDTVQSVFDPQMMESLSYSLKANRKGRMKHRETVFDHRLKTATTTVNDGPPETLSIPDPAQDSLSAVYYLRTREDLASGGTVTFNVFDSGTTTSVEVKTVGKETVKTPAGEFSTIKVSAHKGLFMSEGEILIWFTDDSRRVPVLIKSTISVGSLIFTLRDLKPGLAAP